MSSHSFLLLYRWFYAGLVRPFLFRHSAGTAHEKTMKLLGRLDQHPWTLNRVNQLAFAQHPTSVGGVTLPYPFILAAGLVKGQGFETEAQALAAVDSGQNIIPGWRSVPRLVGPVEFGSFTRWPRLGNSGTVMWRDTASCSTQNRIGLKNPGAKAAAIFLAKQRAELPSIFGINLAVSPGLNDPEQEQAEVKEALNAFLNENIRPSWFTLNLSCPNTEDDPGSHQTASQTRRLCRSLVEVLGATPLWVKLGPNLADEQYRTLMAVFQETGVRAVVATNTLPDPTPENPQVVAGVGGGRLRCRAIAVAALLSDEKKQHGYNVDIVGCGGVFDGDTAAAFMQSGAGALQYWSALVYRGPLAAALIEQEMGET